LKRFLIVARYLRPLLNVIDTAQRSGHLEGWQMKPVSLAFALLSTAGLSATILIGAAAPVPPPTNESTDSNLRPTRNPTPHIYRSGERVSAAYGPFTEVADWKDRGLLSPAEGHRWVHYGDTYLLIKSDSQVITTITRASLPEGRA
jgi:Ni/Co efflux regulator RcnB